MTKRIFTLLTALTLVLGMVSAFTFSVSAEENVTTDLFQAADGLWVMTPHDEAVCNIDYADGYARIYGSMVGKWPSSIATYAEPIIVTPDTALVFDVAFEAGKISIRLNGTAVNYLFTDNLEDNTGDMFGGKYEGAVSFEQLKEALGTNADGNVVIVDLQAFTVDSADCTISLKLVTGYEFPEVSEEPSEEPEESVPAESTTEESKPAEESKNESSAPVTDNSVTVDDGNAKDNTWVWIASGIVVVIVVVVVIVISKKKK